MSWHITCMCLRYVRSQLSDRKGYNMSYAIDLRCQNATQLAHNYFDNIVQILKDVDNIEKNLIEVTEDMLWNIEHSFDEEPNRIDELLYTVSRAQYEYELIYRIKSYGCFQVKELDILERCLYKLYNSINKKLRTYLKRGYDIKGYNLEAELDMRTNSVISAAWSDYAYENKQTLFNLYNNVKDMMFWALGNNTVLSIYSIIVMFDIAKELKLAMPVKEIKTNSCDHPVIAQIVNKCQKIIQ